MAAPQSKKIKPILWDMSPLGKRKKKEPQLKKKPLYRAKKMRLVPWDMFCPHWEKRGKKKEQSHSSRKVHSTEQKNMANPMGHVPTGKRKTKKENKKEP